MNSSPDLLTAGQSESGWYYYSKIILYCLL